MIDESERDDQEAATFGPNSRSEEQDAALFGPPGRGEYQKDGMITFNDPTNGAVLTGKVLFVRAPAPAVVGGRMHPTVYWCYVAGEHFPRAVYSSDIVGKAERTQER